MIKQSIIEYKSFQTIEVSTKSGSDAENAQAPLAIV